MGAICVCFVCVRVTVCCHKLLCLGIYNEVIRSNARQLRLPLLKLGNMHSCAALHPSLPQPCIAPPAVRCLAQQPPNIHLHHQGYRVHSMCLCVTNPAPRQTMPFQPQVATARDSNDNPAPGTQPPPSLAHGHDSLASPSPSRGNRNNNHFIWLYKGVFIQQVCDSTQKNRSLVALPALGQTRRIECLESSASHSRLVSQEQLDLLLAQAGISQVTGVAKGC